MPLNFGAKLFKNPVIDTSVNPPTDEAFQWLANNPANDTQHWVKVNLTGEDTFEVTGDMEDMVGASKVLLQGQEELNNFLEHSRSSREDAIQYIRVRLGLSPTN